jgi:hypothetical protein
MTTSVQKLVWQDFSLLSESLGDFDANLPVKSEKTVMFSLVV